MMRIKFVFLLLSLVSFALMVSLLFQAAIFSNFESWGRVSSSLETRYITRGQLGKASKNKSICKEAVASRFINRKELASCNKHDKLPTPNDARIIATFRSKSKRGLPKEDSTNSQPRTPQRTSLHHLAFGIGSSERTWKARSSFIGTWWQKDVKGAVWLDTEQNLSSSGVSHADYPLVRRSSNISHLVSHGSGTRDFIRIARVVKDTVQLRLPNIRWFVMGDDDTFFNPRGIADLLSKYDHTGMFYIGSKSESHWQNHIVSQEMAFGGGGFAISRPLAMALNRSLDDCLLKYPEIWGSDQRVAICASELGVKRTEERGFHQCDLHLSVSGLLESHPPHVFASLHHFEFYKPVVPFTEDKVAAFGHLAAMMRADPVGFLQQAVCHDLAGGKWTLSIASGYSAKFYPNTVRMENLLKIERTFPTFSGQWGPADYDINTRDVQVMSNSSHGCDLPFAMYAVSSQWKNGFLETEYRREGNNASNVRVRNCSLWPASLGTLRVLKRSKSRVPLPSHGRILGPNLPRLCCSALRADMEIEGNGIVQVSKCNPSTLITQV